MKEFFFTYGCNHKDRNGDSLGRRYTVVKAFDELQARDFIFAARGRLWSKCYRKREEFGIEEYRLIETSLEDVTIPTPHQIFVNEIHYDTQKPR